MKLTFWGHACFLLETGSHRLVIDPFLTGNPQASVKADEVKCDFVLITHGHNDHVGDAVAIAKRNNATVISNFEVAAYCESQGTQAHPLHIGGGHDFSFGRAKLTIAHHGSGLQTDSGMLYMGNPAGLLIISDGKTVYHAGDTGLFMDMQLIGQMNKIDVALLPIGDNFTMGITDALKAVEFLKPATAIPMHYKTFPVIDVDPNEFVAGVKKLGMRAELVNPGESFEF